MSVGKDTIATWLAEAVLEGAQFLVIRTDTYDYSNYPVKCASAAACDIELQAKRDMEKVEECYDLDLDIAEQLAETRAFHTPFERELRKGSADIYRLLAAQMHGIPAKDVTPQQRAFAKSTHWVDVHLMKPEEIKAMVEKMKKSQAQYEDEAQ